jgi:hypothetical protein
VRLIKRLHEISRGGPQREDILRLHGYEDLRDRLELLAVLYHDSGRLDRAIEALQESERLAEERGMRFDGRHLLREYLREQRRAKAAGAVW